MKATYQKNQHKTTSIVLFLFIIGNVLLILFILK